MSHQGHHTHLLAQPSLQSLAATIGGLLLGWPVIHIVGEKGHWAVYFYVFSVWAVLVVLLVFIGRAISRAARASELTSTAESH